MVHTNSLSKQEVILIAQTILIVLALTSCSTLHTYRGQSTVTQTRSLFAGPYFTKSGVPLSEKASYVTPEMFGAVADGLTDDAPSLRLASMYASEKKIPLVLKPGATYFIASKEGSSVINVSYLFLQGNNAHFKVANLGDFDALVHARSTGGYSNISDLTIEFAPNNSTTQMGKEFAEVGARRSCFVLGGTPDGLGEAYVQNVHIINAMGVWEFDFNQCKRGYIKNCVVDYSTQEMSWDRTSIYLGCNNFECSHNQLHGNGYGRTGIETHGYNISIKENSIVGYKAPILLTSVYDTKPSEVDVLSLFCEKNTCNCEQPLQIWAMNNKVSSIIIKDNTISTSRMDAKESGHGSCLWLYDVVADCEIDKILVSNNKFSQAKGNSPAVYLAPSRGAGLVIHDIEFSNNTFNCGNYLIACKSWTTNNLIENITFARNVINCSNSSRIIGVVNSSSMFKKLSFTNNIFKNNPTILNTTSSPNGLSIYWDSNKFDNTIDNATDICNFKGRQNIDYTKLHFLQNAKRE